MHEPTQQAALSESLQDYLEAVYLVAERHGVARVTQIAALVGVGKSSVTGAVQALSERGLVNYDPYQYITLTRRGEAAGRELVRRHRILKRFLIQVLSAPEGQAEAIACKMEHALKGSVFERFVRFLQFLEQRSRRNGSVVEAFQVFCRESPTHRGYPADAAKATSVLRSSPDAIGTAKDELAESSGDGAQAAGDEAQRTPRQGGSPP